MDFLIFALPAALLAAGYLLPERITGRISGRAAGEPCPCNGR
jgi:hypothetical protein